MPSAGRSRLIFLAKFLGVLAAATLLIELKPVDAGLIVPFTEMIATGSAALLQITGHPVRVESTVLIGTDGAVDIKNGCNGVEAVLLLFAAIMAFPAGARSRSIGMAGGLLLIETLNLLRVSSLFVLSSNLRAFDFFHVTVWQAVMFFLTVSYFVLWQRRISTVRR